MLSWIRDKLKRWLEDERRVDTLECLIEGRIRRMAVQSAVGMKLMVTDGAGTWLVGHDQVLNATDFWAAWGQRSNGEYVWDDGSPFRPGAELVAG